MNARPQQPARTPLATAPLPTPAPRTPLHARAPRPAPAHRATSASASLGGRPHRVPKGAVPEPLVVQCAPDLVDVAPQEPAPLAALLGPQRRVPVVLDGVLGAAAEAGAVLRPLVANQGVAERQVELLIRQPVTPWGQRYSRGRGFAGRGCGRQCGKGGEGGGVGRLGTLWCRWAAGNGEAPAPRGSAPAKHAPHRGCEACPQRLCNGPAPAPLPDRDALT
jgi:hypothetical protein